MAVLSAEEHLQEAFWKLWLRQAEGLVLLPDTEGGEVQTLTLAERASSHKACNLERSIHSSVVRRQHMFTV